MTKLLITGTMGYLGRNLARYLLQTSSYDTITGLDITDPEIPGVSHITANITKPETLPKAWAGDIVHTAEVITDGWDDHVTYINLNGTENILNMHDTGRLIHVSTTSVYDLNQPNQNLPETAFHPTTTTYYNTYGESKAAAENLLFNADPREIAPIILRPHILYGPGKPVLPNLTGQTKLFLPDKGRTPHTFTHIKNIIDAIDAALKTTPTATAAYNIVDANPMSLRGAIDLTVADSPRIHGGKTDLLLFLNSFTNTHSEYDLRRYGMERTYNIDKARAAFGYNPNGFTVN